jgi:hypothetical protein
VIASTLVVLCKVTGDRNGMTFAWWCPTNNVAGAIPLVSEPPSFWA